MTERELLREIVEAWNVLPKGFHRPRAVERWLKEDMAPAVKRAADLLNGDGEFTFDRTEEK